MSILPISAVSLSPRIAQLAQDRLRESPYYYLKGLRCRCEGETVVLEGEVPYDSLKGLAEAIVWRVEGIREVVNLVRVRDPMLSPLVAPAMRNAG